MVKSHPLSWLHNPKLYMTVWYYPCWTAGPFIIDCIPHFAQWLTASLAHQVRSCFDRSLCNNPFACGLRAISDSRLLTFEDKSTVVLRIVPNSALDLDRARNHPSHSHPSIRVIHHHQSQFTIDLQGIRTRKQT